MGILGSEIFNSGGSSFGLDLSDLSLKAIQIERTGRRRRVKGYSYARVPSGWLNDGEISETSELASLIRESIGKACYGRISTRNVVCSLPESKVFLRKIAIPKMENEEKGEAVRWEIEANIPLSVDQVYYDWQEVSEEGGKTGILTVAIAKEYVDRLVETLEMAGLNLRALEVESIATARSLVPRAADPDELYFVADIGARRTSFIITEGNVPCFTSSIPFSSEGMNDIISKELAVDAKEAEKVKISRGIGRMSDADSLLPALDPYLRNLSGGIEKSLDFYQTVSRPKSGKKVRKVIFCGGGSNLKGLIPYMAKSLKADSVMGDPWINIDMGGRLPAVSREDSTEFATAIGLAISTE